VKNKKRLLREYAEAIITALILALVIRAYVIQAFKIPSGSMLQTLLVGDHILVNKFIYGTKIPFSDRRVLIFKKPERGDIIVFKYPENPKKEFTLTEKPVKNLMHNIPTKILGREEMIRETTSDL
jgi:signal peptidase I